ncbi:hypothetical protein WA1_18925 [Scytonema hofmannii PCC 7110]|uniref:Uncharacterized protein n=1 Tax=Scytonema hofmannii PCC 7110 TaxID=128403 RepID=A0A139XBJ7_9CYAN|nr:hypothetical protein [Scytonema hofmannii]KYC42077.1 hypothetical protein WA1_18925 [Scytonema hofmannii PCC 7110]
MTNTKIWTILRNDDGSISTVRRETAVNPSSRIVAKLGDLVQMTEEAPSFLGQLANSLGISPQEVKTKMAEGALAFEIPTE